jgi:hypothetical protein
MMKLKIVDPNVICFIKDLLFTNNKDNAPIKDIKIML